MTLLNIVDFPRGSDGKELSCDAGYLGSIPGFGRSLEKGMATHSSNSCLENPHGQRNLVAGYSLWGRRESDMTEQLRTLNRVNNVSPEKKKCKGNQDAQHLQGSEI